MNNLPSSLQIHTDLTESDIEKVKEFIEAGMPGISTVTDAKLFRMLDLYMGGSTYSQISSMCEVKSIHVLYFAHAANWYDLKKNYLNEIQEKIRARVVDTKLRSQEFMLLLVQAWQKRIGRKLTRYLATDDESHMIGVDLKEVAQLMKAMEMVSELEDNGKTKDGKTPPIGLNVGAHGVNIEKTGENTLTITPKEATMGNLLQQMADDRRNKEKEVEVKSIKNDNNKDTGENNEK